MRGAASGKHALLTGAGSPIARSLAEHLARTRGLPSVDVRTPHHSTWLDNTKAKFLLGWRPRYDLARMADEAFDYHRAADDPRVIWYPG